MWNIFRRKDPMKEVASVYYLAEKFFPLIVKGYNNRKYEETIFEDINAWKELLANETGDKDFRFKKIKTVGTDFKNNHDDYLVLITWPEVSFPTSAKACMIVLNRPKHYASEYILESSFGGSMIVKIEGDSRYNTGITIPSDQNELTNFTMAVVKNENIRIK